MMRQSYSDMLKDDDERMKIISPTYRELGKKKYDEMMEQKQREIKREMKELRLKQVEELKEILNNNSKNKSDSDTLIIYSYNLKYKDYMDQIIPCFLRALYKKYGKVHFTSFSYCDKKEKVYYYNVPHDVIELDENLHKLNWHYDFFENTKTIESESNSINYFYDEFSKKYKHIYEYTFEYDNELKYFKDNIRKFKKNILCCFERENLRKIFNNIDDVD